MFVIYNEQNQSPRPRNTGAAGGRKPEPPVDATQRVSVPQQTAARRPAQAAARPAQKRNKNIMPIVLIVIAAILLIAIIVTVVSIFAKPTDDGRILNNVYAAGVDLGNMTPEQAKEALHAATDNTYTKLNMTVKVLEETILLTPEDTGAKLDVDAVVEAAYNYGRTGSKADQQKAKTQALLSSYHVPIIEHLNLDTDHIRQVLAQLGTKYSTTLTQPSVTVTGERPSMTQDSYDTTVVHQTLTLFVGTAEYGLSADAIYGQILDAYSSNLFEVAAECTVLAPDAIDLDALYDQHCKEPVDAQIDDKFNTTPEVYGYGFDLEAVRTQLTTAPYGTRLEIPLTFIKPAITADDLSGEMFQDMLSKITTAITGESDLKINLTQACAELNGLVLKAGDIFSFNEVIGQPSTRNGYRPVQILVGKKMEKVVGGGISQVASTLYYAAIKADLSVTERHNHTYAPTFIEAGLDADISYGTKDLRFTNSTNQPIRIEAAVVDNNVVITIWGTNDKDYTVNIANEIVRTYEPVTLVQTLPKDHPGNYIEGQILVDGIVGYDVITYKTYVYTDGSSNSQEYEVGQSHYEKRNRVVVELEKEVTPPPTEPTEPSIPSEPTVPSEPTEPSVPSEPTEPSDPSESTEPDGSEEP